MINIQANTWYQAGIAYDQIQQNYNPKLELIIATSPFWANQYAKNVLKAPFPIAEPIIANSYESLEYAKNVLKSRFKLAENIHIKKHYLSYYTKYILKFNHD